MERFRATLATLFVLPKGTHSYLVEPDDHIRRSGIAFIKILRRSIIIASRSPALGRAKTSSSVSAAIDEYTAPRLLSNRPSLHIKATLDCGLQILLVTFERTIMEEDQRRMPPSGGATNSRDRSFRRSIETYVFFRNRDHPTARVAQIRDRILTSDHETAVTH